MKLIDEFRDRLDILLKDAAGNLDQPDKDAAIRDAVGQYSKDRPRVVVADIEGAGSYDLALPAEWEEGFSEVRQIFFPLAADERNSPELEADAWELYQKPDSLVLRLLNDTPAVGQTLRLKFTARHSVPEPAPVEIAAEADGVEIAAAPDGVVRAAGIVTLTTVDPHGAAEGDEIAVEDVADASFNGTFEVATAPDANTLTYEQAGDDATSGGGTVEVVEDPPIPDGAVRATEIVTLTTVDPHGAAEDDEIAVQDVADASFNGTFEVATAPDANTLTYEQAGDDATSGGGTVEVVEYATVPESDFDGFCHLAASFAFEQLAALKIQSGDPTISSDVVDYRTKSDQYRSAAKAHRALYDRALERGAEAGSLKAASNVRDLNVDLSTGGDRLTHPRSTQ